MIIRNKFNAEYKRKIGLEVASGVSSASEISKREGISSTTIYKWRDQVSGVRASDEESEVLELKKLVRELEETVSDQALEIHILKKTQKIMSELKKQERLSGSISPQDLELKKVVKR